MTDNRRASESGDDVAELRYRALFESMLGGVAYCRVLYESGRPVDFIYLDVNPAFEALTGLKNVVGRRASEVIPGIRESDPKLFEILGRVATGGKSERFEIYVEALSAWFDISVYSPAAEHFVAVFDVITERKRMERGLEVFRALIDHSNDVFEVLDLVSGRFLDVNERGCLDLGYTREEYLALTVFDIDPTVTPAGFARVGKEIRRAGSLLWEGIHRRKDGSTYPVEVTVKHVHLDRDYIVAVVRDITERRRAEREHLQFMLGVARSSDAIFLTDREGTITYVNPAFEKLYGYSKAEAVGKTPRLLKSGAQEPGVYDAFWSKLLANEVVQIELINRAKDGRLVHVDASANPILDDRGEMVGFLAIQRDITERTEAAAARVQVEEQLRTAQKMEAIGSLAGGVAHDFNNLLSVILSYTGFALDDLRLPDPVRDDLVEVMKAGERAAALTRQLLAFGRKQVLQPVPLDLNQVAETNDKMLRRIIGEDVDLRLALAPDLGLTLADPGQVEQVIMNLAVNARDAMPRGGTLTIRTENVELDEGRMAGGLALTAGPYVLLAVSDTGSGIDEQTLPRIFEPFFTTKERGRGTGLGLATVYGIVKQSGGAVSVRSSIGMGTTFEIYLPRAAAPSLDDPRRATSKPPAVGTETILVVEDEEAVRKLAERILRAAGYAVITAVNGNDALLTCESHHGTIHLVLTDVVMPQMSGRVLAERLAALRPETKVLYMSGHTDDAVFHHGVLDPGVHFLGKPFSPAELTKRVRDVLDSEPR